MMEYYSVIKRIKGLAEATQWMNMLWKHYAKLKKPVVKDHELYVSSYMTGAGGIPYRQRANWWLWEAREKGK
jgi:hypothetical protein